MRKYKVFNVTVTVIITTLSVVAAVFIFSTSYLRFWESLVDLWASIKFYFCELFDIENTIIPTVEGYSKILNFDISMSEDWDGFQVESTSYFSLFFDKNNFISYWNLVAVKLGLVARYLTILLPCFLLLVLAIKRIYETGNTKHNQDTKPLKCTKRLLKCTFEPIKRLVLQYIEFVKERNYIYIIWTLLWIFNFNLASIVIAFFAYYFYFAVSFKFETIYVQVCKLFIPLRRSRATRSHSRFPESVR